ncbi:Mobile element protein [hydrothermal vent metagenome]|uniref:Mobile element protein n=1 Tax=hydrothermal vent metagenome TaxID=652676 RepID=A0A1W1DZH2_9ZZZZ
MDKKIKISTETTYRFVLQNKAVGGVLYQYLRHQHISILIQNKFQRLSLRTPAG